MKRVLVTGSNSPIGRVICDALVPHFNVIRHTRDWFDLEDSDRVYAISCMGSVHGLVHNAAAFESDVDCVRINHTSRRALDKMASCWTIDLIDWCDETPAIASYELAKGRLQDWAELYREEHQMVVKVGPVHRHKRQSVDHYVRMRNRMPRRMRADKHAVAAAVCRLATNPSPLAVETVGI